MNWKETLPFTMPLAVVMCVLIVCCSSCETQRQKQYHERHLKWLERNADRVERAEVN